MYNETTKKITSLTLLTILLASSAAIALPNAMPAAHAASNANLFVSAENSQWNNYFAGPQVIQVVVADPDINRLDQAYGEPVVTVNGKRLRMAQATDGNWYAYFADSKQSQIADSTQGSTSGKGLDFGKFCSLGSAQTAAGVDFTETKGIAVARAATGATDGSQNPSATVGATCTAASTGSLLNHVIRENKTLNGNAPGGKLGQIATNNAALNAAWPVVQLYDFASLPSSVTVDYQKNGGDQIVNLTFDRIPSNLITTTVDRSAYPENANVFVTMNDPQLNIDPTEEDSWTWGANATNSTLYYQAFNRNGAADADGSTAMQNLVGNLTSFMFNHNGKLTINPSASGTRVIDFQKNGKEALSPTRGDPAVVHTASVVKNSEPITFIESGGVNTGVFANWDGSKTANIITVNSDVIRGQSASLRYNDISQSIVGGFSFGSITQSVTNNTWASGQRSTVTLTDGDANLNSKLTEHLNLYDPKVLRISTMKIGTPFSLSSGNPTSPSETSSIVGVTGPTHTGAGLYSFNFVTGSKGNATGVNLAKDESFSFRPIFNYTNSTVSVAINTGSGMFVDLKTTADTLFKTIHPTNATNGEGFKGFNFLNYDLRSLSGLNGATGNSIASVQVYLVHKNGAISTSSGLPVSGLTGISVANSTNLQDFINLNVTNANVDNPNQLRANLFGTVPKTDNIGLLFVFTVSGSSTNSVILSTSGEPVVADFFSVGLIGDGSTNAQRINNGIYRFELEETGDNTGVFTGTNQYLMLNQLNIYDTNTYTQLRTINHDVKFVAIQDMLQSEARAPQVTYLDLGADGVNTQVSAQQDLPTHTGVISFDSKTYKIGDTVTITLNDADLNVDNDLIDIYTAVKPTTNAFGAIQPSGQDIATDTVGKANLGKLSDGRAFGRLVDIQFGQANIRWSNSNITSTTTTHNTASCFTNSTGSYVDSNGGTSAGFATSLSATGFSLVETGPSTGIFTGTFEVPDQLCQDGTIVGAVGQNIKVNYVDFRDASGKLVEVSDNAGIKGNTGSVKLDKAVYPVPFGTVGTTDTNGDFAQQKSSSSLNGVFPLHRDIVGQTAANGGGIINANVLPSGDTIIHIRVNDQDYNTSPTGTDHIAVSNGFAAGHGVVAVQISRSGYSMLLATAGAQSAATGKIVNLNQTTGLPAYGSHVWSLVRELGPMTEIAPDAGIFQADLPIKLTDGPAGADCPKVNNYDGSISGKSGYTTNVNDRFYYANGNGADPSGNPYCVRQGDVLTVTYNDTSDASGHSQTVTDSSTFDLRNGVLQSDKSVYIIGSDMILTLVEPDFNQDSQAAETAPLDLIEWDSHAFKGTMGTLGGQASAFDAKPNTFVETGKDTGIFQSVIKIPKSLKGNLLERGEQIHLEYTDWGPAGSKTVGKNNQDIQLTIYTSNFGATVELDQKVYTWTDRVYITVVAPDHNFDPNLIDTIGDNSENQVTVSTRGNNLSPYKLVETGVDTGIFTGYVILQGDKSIVGTGGVDGAGMLPVGSQGVVSGSGPTDGFLPATEQDGVSVSFEFTRDQTVTGSALIRWNIGEIKWLEASYPANGQGVLQIVDPDMNLNPKAVDKFDTNVWSDSDSGGIKLTMTETGEATGIFQGTVYFTTNFQSSGNRLHVAEGDTVTGEYRDRTLPPPYTPNDQLRLTATTFIGTIVPPLERAPASNPRIVDSFGNAITGAVKSGQQIQITADLTNGQDRDQPFAYLVQIQDANGVTVSLSWITGTLTAGQSLNPAQSWTPQSSGTYTAQIFVWQSIDNPNALSPPLTTTINVA
ncbi:conserved exported hypothetical protein [Nitrosotalea sinensis]|uniref:Uncharacterized protein n=1 Tax=Nitrosotalea sinensis TaxID=1499975 RepID=A0A2H1EEM1_9ARCH|nr:hypothetical protein [Candidatus Nitrosotalea sinensis]SHO42787.1 conserved exported hypothetical protein [Candidatus Nitrosotalea sinensis]